MASPEGTLGSGVGQATKGLGVRRQELVKEGAASPLLDANSTSFNLT